MTARLSRTGTTSFRFEIDGMEELIDSVERMGKLPRKCVRGAARKGSNVALKAARALAPVYTGPEFEGIQKGALKKGIIKKEERSKDPGKAVFDIKIDKAKNDIFVKMVNQKRSYYPASMEYGFIKRDGSKHPGFHYLKNSLEQNKDEIERVMVQDLTKRIDAEWNKGG